jgi:hypothetical protein
VLRRRDKGKPVVRRGRKAYGLALNERAGSQATERRWSYFLPWRISTLNERKEWGIYERLIKGAGFLSQGRKGQTDAEEISTERLREPARTARRSTE